MHRAIPGLLASAVLVVMVGTSTFAAAQNLRNEIESIVQEYLAANPDEIGKIAKDYFVKHPEALQEVMTELLKRRSAPSASRQGPPAAGVDSKAALKSNAEAIFSSPRQVTIGNRGGDVTMVEFFDYNCGFCKRALTDMLGLIKADPKLRVVLKEFPILGPGSAEAARVAVAVRMQDPGGEKYLAFHQKLLSGRGPADRATALAAAKEAGLDTARLEEDMVSDEAKGTLEESMVLARSLGINATPSYVIGDNVIVGAVGIAALTENVKAARKQ